MRTSVGDTKHSPIPAAHWWSMAARGFSTVREFIERAQKSELAENGHECGHEWEITVSSRLHISGPGEHTDADWSDACEPVTVRAHNLRDALLIAASLPLGDWFPQEWSDGDEQHNRDAMEQPKENT